MMKMSDKKKIILILFYFISPVISITYFTMLIWDSARQEMLLPRIFTNIMGVAPFIWFTYEFILMARPKFLDQIFGMKKILKFHVWMSIISISMAFCHGMTQIFIICHEISSNSVISGVLAFFFLLVLMLLSGFFMIETILTKVKAYRNFRDYCVKKFNYSQSLKIHNITLIATTFLLMHLLLSSSGIYSSELRAIFLIHYFVGFSFWFFHKIIKPMIIKRMYAYVDPEKCISCGTCAKRCPYGYITVDKEKKTPAYTNPILCKGCGTCAASCPKDAIIMTNFTDAIIQDH